MAKKAAIAVLLGLGTVVGTVFVVSRVKAAQEPEIPELREPMIPTPNDILASNSLGELEIWYIYIGQLLVTRKIDAETYEELYGAYSQRFYQLTGWQP